VVDPCDGVVCFNNGFCLNGECQCPDGFSGPACLTQVTPAKIRISRIDVTKFPQYDNGATWDVGSGPDIFVMILDGTDIVYNSPTYYEDADASQTYSFEPTSLVDLNDPYNQYTIALFDYDFGVSNDDIMSASYFTPYNSNGGFPTKLTIGNSEVTFELYVSYVW
jgi:hypothetical protein